MVVCIIELALELKVEDSIVDLLVDDRCILDLHRPLCKLKTHDRLLRVFLGGPDGHDESCFGVAAE